MDKLDQVALFNIAIMLDLDNLLSFCSSSSEVNRLICQQDAIWLFKLAREFPDWRQHLNMKPRDAYKLLIGLSKLKIEIKYEGSIYQLYKVKELDLIGKGLTSLPPEIGQLNQLQVIDLSDNQLKSLPSEIGQLRQLQILDLHDNQLESLPSEMCQLNQLRVLYLNKSQELYFKPQLQKLYLHNNRLQIIKVS
jgi:hypothetical protein